MEPNFTIFPAIDLRHGQVVRLQMGDPTRQTVYSCDPQETAQDWINAGADWLHVVNLDGAFGEVDSANHAALEHILAAALSSNASIQFGGGLRSLTAIQRTLEMGVNRVVLGTVVIEQPTILDQALQRWGADQVAVSLDAQDGLVRVRGWQAGTSLQVLDVARRLQAAGLKWLVFTDIARDGLEKGFNLEQTHSLSRAISLWVIASGGVSSLAEVQQARRSGLAGIIVGKALYSGAIDAKELFKIG